ncbi:MAG: hypothetical protein ACYST9_01485 [Planctomycetota bacterium]|jgi:hypothetical protein
MKTIKKKNNKLRAGLTLMELFAAMIISIIVILGAGFILVSNHKGFEKLYERANGDVATDGYVAQKRFENVIRNASREKVVFDTNSVEIYYYDSNSAPLVDRYARFYKTGGDLNFEYGVYDPKKTLEVSTVCSNVSACSFYNTGRSVQMKLVLDDGLRSVEVMGSAVMNNP